MTLDPEIRLAHYGYRVGEISGQGWAYSPAANAYRFPTKAAAVTAATSALDADLERCERMVALRRTIPMRVAG